MRNETKDARYLWLLLVAALALGLHIWLTPYASPTAALRLRVQREEASRFAMEFLAKEKVRVPVGYRTVTTFVTDGEPKNYLEQTLGLQMANRVAQTEGFVYAWQVRLFRPGTLPKLSSCSENTTKYSKPPATTCCTARATNAALSSARSRCSTLKQYSASNGAPGTATSNAAP